MDLQPLPNPTGTRRPKVRWHTRQIALDQNDRDLYVKLTIRELSIYIVFFAIFLFSSSGLYSRYTYVVNQEISSLFVDTSFASSSDEDAPTIKFDDITTMEHFWKYFYIVLCDKLYEIPIGNSKDSSSKILFENKFLYRPRARQVRVEEGHCEIRNELKGLFKECYVPFEIQYEDHSSFGPKKGTQWTYSDELTTQALPYDGEIASYGGGGYYFDFPVDKSDAKSLIDDLKHNTWLDRGTRAIFLDFAVYNCNLNVICVVKLVFEFPASGGIQPSTSFRTVKLYRYAVSDSLPSLIAMLVVVVFIVYYTAEEVFEMVYFRLDYFNTFWNLVDLGIVVLGWFSVLTAMAIAYQDHWKFKLLENATDAIDHRSYKQLVIEHETLVQVAAYTTFLVSIKIIKYADLNRTMTVMYLSIGRCFKIVINYLIIMTIVVAAFAVLGYCAFGAQVKGFSTVRESFLSALRILMRDFDFRSLEHADQAFTTFFFVLFTCVVVFVLLTMLIAIVFHAYFDVDVEELLSERKVYVCDKVSAFVDDALFRIGFKKWSTQRRQHRLKAEQDSHIGYQDIYKILKRCHFTDTEVENVLKKYGVEPQKMVHEDEARRMFKDVLYNRSASNDAAMTSEKSDVEWLVKRVDLLENSLDEVHKKCDVIIARLDAIRVHLPPNYAEETERNS